MDPNPSSFLPLYFVSHNSTNCIPVTYVTINHQYLSKLPPTSDSTGNIKTCCFESYDTYRIYPESESFPPFLLFILHYCYFRKSLLQNFDRYIVAGPYSALLLFHSLLILSQCCWLLVLSSTILYWYLFTTRRTQTSF